MFVSLIEKCGWTACHPVGTTTTVYLWSTLAAALPNGIFLELTASKCDTLACVCLCCWRSASADYCNKAVWVFFVCIELCECVCVGVVGGVLSQGAQRTCSVVTWGWLRHDWMAAGDPLWQAALRGREGTCSDFGVRLFHPAAVLISNIQSCCKDLGCLIQWLLHLYMAVISQGDSTLSLCFMLKIHMDQRPIYCITILNRYEYQGSKLLFSFIDYE